MTPPDAGKARAPITGRGLLPGLLYGAAVGFLLWALSPSLLGTAEPWDPEPHAYGLVMVGAGAGLGLLESPSPATGFLGAWLGQVVALFALPHLNGPWLHLGVLTTGVGSLVFLAAGWAGRWVRRLAAGPGEAN